MLHIKKNNYKNLRQKLIKNGKTLFSSKGFKKTGVREIIKLTGISIGTFYNYFSSKEELFLTIFTQENKRVHEKLHNKISKLIEQGKDPIEILKILVHDYYDIAQNNPILRHGFDIEQFIKITDKLTPEQREESRTSILGPFVPYFTRWKEEGKIADVKLEVLAGSIDSITYIYANREKIEEELFKEITDYLIENVIEGLRVKD